MGGELYNSVGRIYMYTVDSRQKAGCQELDARTSTSAALRYTDNGTRIIITAGDRVNRDSG